MSSFSGVRVYRGWSRIRDKAFTLAVRRSFYAFGSHSTVQPPLRVAGERHMSIGSHVFIAASSWLQVLEGFAESPLLEIGDETSMAGSTVISAALEVRLGRAVLLARNVYIADHNHSYRDITRPVLEQGIDGIAPVRIGDGAWLGQNAVVCPGVTIGKGAVVAANSVVKDDVPDHALVAGSPSRLVRRFGEEAVRG